MEKKEATSIHLCGIITPLKLDGLSASHLGKMFLCLLSERDKIKLKINDGMKNPHDCIQT